MAERTDKITSIIVVGRDKFSPTARCLRSVLDNTPEPNEMICVLGGAPKKIKDELKQTFSGKVRFIWREEFLAPTTARNIGLRECKTKYAIVMDNDVEVHPQWLKNLLDCQRETGAVMVMPLVLEDNTRIHTGANYLYVTEKNGKKYGFKELSFHGLVVGEKTTLKREAVDYGELHCQLIEVEPAISLKAYDENMLEVGECDNGLTFQRAGLKQYFEPKAVVNYMVGHPIQPEDIRFFIWRWDMRGILEGYRHFERKWGIDITEYGEFAYFLFSFQNRVGFFARKFPSRFGMNLDKAVHSLVTLHMKILGKLASPWKKFWKKELGFNEWLAYMPDNR